jgi:phage terminase large subunit GpA-like protein
VNDRVSHDILAAPATVAAARAARSVALRAFAPRAELTIAEWAETYRELSEEEGALPGRYSLEETPVLRGILAAISDPNVRKVVSQKSAQVGYTVGVACNVIGYHIHWRPSTVVALFPVQKSSKDFANEKLEPMIRATPVLAERVNLKSRSPGTGTLRRKYPGGLLKLVASGSPGDMKSTSARVCLVEEPDDVSTNVRGQGNAIGMAAERTKTYAPDDLQVIGGTPTAKDTSQIAKEMRSTDQRYFKARCTDCGEAHTPEWEHVTIPGFALTEAELALPRDELDALWPEREVYGRARWEDAFYACPHCGSVWSDDQRIENIRTAARVPPLYGWEPTAESTTPGFYLNELLSTFDGSRVPELARKFLEAKHELDRGNAGPMIVFWNSTVGRPWEYRGDLPEEDELRERAEPYAEWTCPAAALVPIAFVDVQHDRLAVCVWVVGRGEEMWLAYWGELYGRTIVAHAGAWLELEQLMARTVRHASGAELSITAFGIDSGDGQTSEAVYDFVRKHNRADRRVYATKGASDAVGRIEIWTPPKRSVEPGRKTTQAAKHGVRPRQIGAAKAKDLILGWAQHGGRVRLQGTGPGRMHWFEGVRPDFYEQLLGEMKIPSQHNPRIREWKERLDRRNEALDCTVGCVWLCRELKLHLLSARHWDSIAARVLRRVADAAAKTGEIATAAVAEAARAAVVAPSQGAAPAAAVTEPAPAPTPPAPQPAEHLVASVSGNRISIAAMGRFAARPTPGRNR